MLYCCVSIDYLSQLERTGYPEAPALIDRLRSLAASFGGVCGSRRVPLAMAFPAGGLFDGIQAAEALERIAETVRALEPRLRGAAVIVHETATAEDALAYHASSRLADASEYLYEMSPEAKTALGAFGALARAGWSSPSYRSALGDADSGRLFERPRLAETIAKAIGRTCRSGPRLLHLDAGKGVRDIASASRAQAGDATPLLCLEGLRTRSLPFSPLVELVQAGARGAYLVDRDAAPLAIIAQAAYARGVAASVRKGCAEYLEAWLDAFGAAGGVVVCDDPASFSPGLIELVAGRLASGRGDERYLSIADGGLLEAWAGPWAAKVSAGLADGDEPEEAIERALAGVEGRTREALRDRFRHLRGLRLRAADSTSAILERLPREAALYLYAAIAAGRELSSEELSAFARSLGLLPEGERLVAGILARAGLLAPSGRPLEPFGAEAAVVGAETARLIDERLSAFLIERYRAGSVRPSLGFLRRVGERAKDERLLYDCLFDAVSRPDMTREEDEGFLSPGSLAMYRFWSALTRRDENAALSAASEAERALGGPRGPAVRALIMAELGYALGDPARAAKGARDAMLAMGKDAPPKLEARSHRMMGLASLALDRHAEASDYLTNAQELAESVGSDHERMMAAYAKAIAEFMTGALGRSSKAAQAAEDAARRLHRVDAIAAIEALRGRMELDLGCYEEAATRFASIAALSADYAIAGAPERASIWRARALGYAGEHDEAERELEAFAGDPEARAFRAELDILRGRPREARAWLEPPAGPERRPFMPPDAFDWSSLYAEFEGRSLGFLGSESPFSTFRTALSLFARGLDERDPSCAVELHALSRSERGSRHDPSMGVYCFFCYLLEERLAEPPVDRQTVLSRAFKILQERAGRIEQRTHRALYMERNAWNRRLMAAAREHKFI